MDDELFALCMLAVDCRTLELDEWSRPSHADTFVESLSPGEVRTAQTTQNVQPDYF